MPKPVDTEKHWEAGRRVKIARIRDVATREFCNHGYAASSLQEIANEAEIHKATLYHYFESKEHLLAHILDHAHDQVLGIIEGVRTSDLGAVERLRQFLVNQLCWYLENIELARVTFHEWTNVGDQLIEAQTERRRIVDRYLRSLIKAAQETHSTTNDRDIGLAANYITGAMNAAPAWYARNGDLSPKEIADLYADMALKALGIAVVEEVTRSRSIEARSYTRSRPRRA